jgi:hypothetical protein
VADNRRMSLVPCRRQTPEGKALLPFVTCSPSPTLVTRPTAICRNEEGASPLR